MSFCAPVNKVQYDRVQINGSHFAICEAFLRFCEANFIQKYKKAKLMKIL